MQPLQLPTATVQLSLDGPLQPLPRQREAALEGKVPDAVLEAAVAAVLGADAVGGDVGVDPVVLLGAVADALDEVGGSAVDGVLLGWRELLCLSGGSIMRWWELLYFSSRGHNDVAGMLLMMMIANVDEQAIQPLLLR